MKALGKPLISMPKYVRTPSFHRSLMSTPSLFFRPMLVRLAQGQHSGFKSIKEKREKVSLGNTYDPVKLSNPVASTTTSNSLSFPSSINIPFSVKVLSGVLFRSTISTCFMSRHS